MSRKLQLLLIAGLLVPAAMAEAQSRPRISIVRPHIEGQFVLRNRIPAFRRFEFDRSLFRRQASARWNLLRHSGPVFRGRGSSIMRNRSGQGFMRFRIGRRHSIRI